MQVKPRTIFSIFAAFALVALAAPAEAHVIAAGPGGLAQGFAHPFGGLDHVLAMVAVGLWAAHLGGRARWLVPASFVATMGLAGAAAMAGLALPYVETGIALTVVALGALLLARARMATALGMAVVGSFAVFHGLAHGIEAPLGAGLAYGAGFVVATALLHGLGLGVGFLSVRGEHGLSRLVTRLGGGMAVAAGVALMVV